jgi:hypothetical protein
MTGNEFLNCSFRSREPCMQVPLGDVPRGMHRSVSRPDRSPPSITKRKMINHVPEDPASNSQNGQAG